MLWVDHMWMGLQKALGDNVSVVRKRDRWDRDQRRMLHRLADNPHLLRLEFGRVSRCLFGLFCYVLMGAIVSFSGDIQVILLGLSPHLLLKSNVENANVPT
jgi:hypothetical protein